MSWRLGHGGAAALAAAVAASPTWAQENRADPARLRAGEHPGFSRVALDVPQLGDWTIDRDGRRLAVAFPGRRLDFDTRQIAPERRVSRVAAARTETTDEGTLLVLSLSCSCEATAFEFRSGMLVIDIRPEADPADDAPGDAQTGSTAAAVAAAEPDGGAAPPAAGRAAAPSDPDGVSLEEAQSRLLEQLTRAADQGLIAFREPASANDVAPAPDSVGPAATEDETGAEDATDDDDREPTPVATAAAHPPDAAPAPVQLDARTAYDPPRPPAPGVAAEPSVTCPPPSSLDVAAWATDEDVHHQISMRRGALVAEFDRSSTDAAVALARLYIRHGFGREARQVLRSFASDAPDAALLHDLAAIADGDPAAADGPLGLGGPCRGPAALWRLAGGLPPTPETADDPVWREELLDAFADLPVDLRRRTGPALVEALAGAGQLGAAEAARRLLDRAPGDHGDRWRLAIARLARASGEGEAALRLFTSVAQSDAAEAPEAMLELADLLGARGASAPPWLIDDIALAAFRHQGTPLGRRLLTAEVLARAGNRQLAPALDLLASQLVAGRAMAADVDAARRTILETADAAANGPAVYAATLLDHAPSFGDGPNWDAARLHMTAELTGIGLANAAAAILAPTLDRGSETARLAAARIDLAQGAPGAALARLDGLSGPAADLVRAAALEAEGRHLDAWRAAAPHLSAEAADRAELAWRAGVWEAATALPPGDPRRELAGWMARMSGPAPLPDTADDPVSLPPTLARAQGAIDAAGALRRTIERALDDG